MPKFRKKPVIEANDIKAGPKGEKVPAIKGLTWSEACALLGKIYSANEPASDSCAEGEEG